MLIEDMLIYASYALGIGVIIWILKVCLFPKSTEKLLKKYTEWTMTPPTAALSMSKMKTSGSGTSKNVNRKNILSNKSSNITDSKKKAANWKEVGSFDEDVGQIDLDAIMKKKNKTENVKNVFEKGSATHINNIPTQNEMVLKEKEYKTKVLLVDDSAVVLKKTGDMLRKNGYEVITKKDGQEALQWSLTQNNPPDVIVTDMEMPKMTGEELVEYLRKNDAYLNIPILVISAHAERHISLMEKQMIQGFLRKPFTEEDLISQIEFFLNE